MTELEIECYLIESPSKDSRETSSTFGCFKLSRTCTYDELVDKIRKEMESLVSDNFITYWFNDKENEFVVFKTDFGLQNAIGVLTARNKTLAFYVQDDKKVKSLEQVVEFLKNEHIERETSKALGIDMAITISPSQVFQYSDEIQKNRDKPIKTNKPLFTIKENWIERIDKWYNENAQVFKKLEEKYTEWVANGVPLEEIPPPIAPGEIFLESIASKSTACEASLISEGKKMISENQKLTEAKHQHPFFCEIMAVIMNGLNHTFLHEKPIFKNQQRAAFSAIKSGQPNVLIYCISVFELLVNKKIDHDHLCKVLMYNEHILESNPKRSSIVSIVSNLQQIIVFRTCREKDGGGTLKQCSKEMNFWTDGIKFIRYILEDPSSAGYDESLDFKLILSDNAEYFPTKYIGQGQSAHVFLLEKLNDQKTCFTPSNMIIKVFKEKYYYQKEKEKLKELRELNINFKRVIREVDVVNKCDEYKAIVFEPLGKLLSKERLTMNLVCQMIDCVRELHDHGLIHRDLSPSHFYVSTTCDHVFVIDIGSAIIMPKEQQARMLIPYAGTIQYAADEILENHEDYYMYTPQRRHDIESLFKTIFCIHHEIVVPNFGFDNIKTPLSPEQLMDLFKKTADWWKRFKILLEKFSAFAFWKDGFDIVRKTSESDDLLGELEQHFQDNFFFFDASMILNLDDQSTTFQKSNDESMIIS